MQALSLALFCRFNFSFLATISTNCCDDLPLLCIMYFSFHSLSLSPSSSLALVPFVCLLCIMSNFFHFFFLYFIQLHFPRSFQRINFIFFSFARLFFLYFNVNKFVLCEYYIICQTYSVIQFVHTEFYFVALSSRCVCERVCLYLCTTALCAVAAVSAFFFFNSTKSWNFGRTEAEEEQEIGEC